MFTPSYSLTIGEENPVITYANANIVFVDVSSVYLCDGNHGHHICCCSCYKGVDFRSVYSEVDSKLVSMKICDTAGQERLVEGDLSACNSVGTFTPVWCAVYLGFTGTLLCL